ncbi:hypothetical protein [Pedobacter paludis]|uniref:Uncharacterized protein n=1 Tax=Pedobacter paludis TaxID=2203212 RepID=A0A317EVH4_9SPHI|nr:hypothetical protein [Pedobacter paludis]PWS30442.1 hypothetical protein DF947_18650 [Pedobacter paludis]
MPFAIKKKPIPASSHFIKAEAGLFAQMLPTVHRCLHIEAEGIILNLHVLGWTADSLGIVLLKSA